MEEGAIAREEAEDEFLGLLVEILGERRIKRDDRPFFGIDQTLLKRTILNLRNPAKGSPAFKGIPFALGEIDEPLIDARINDRSDEQATSRT
jgi:hypothetical protein